MSRSFAREVASQCVAASERCFSADTRARRSQYGSGAGDRWWSFSGGGERGRDDYERAAPVALGRGRPYPNPLSPSRPFERPHSDIRASGNTRKAGREPIYGAAPRGPLLLNMAASEAAILTPASYTRSRTHTHTALTRSLQAATEKEEVRGEGRGKTVGSWGKGGALVAREARGSMGRKREAAAVYERRRGAAASGRSTCCGSATRGQAGAAYTLVMRGG